MLAGIAVSKCFYYDFDQRFKTWLKKPYTALKMKFSIKSAEATCVEIASEIKKCFRLKNMLNFNILWNF